MDAALVESGNDVNFVVAGLHGLLRCGRAGCGGPCFVDIFSLLTLLFSSGLDMAIFSPSMLV
jgi:hypothetical protein